MVVPRWLLPQSKLPQQPFKKTLFALLNRGEVDPDASGVSVTQLWHKSQENAESCCHEACVRNYIAQVRSDIEAFSSGFAGAFLDNKAATSEKTSCFCRHWPR